MLLNVDVDVIEERPDALRTVDVNGDDYQLLQDSVKKDGVLLPICITPAYLPDGQTRKTTEDGREVFTLVDGLQRLTAARMVGLKTIPAQSLNMNEFQILVTQIIANARKVETKPVEYSRQIQRILAMDPTLGKHQLADRLSCSAKFIDERLGLLKLDEEIGKLVDAGEILLTNAYQLAKLSPEDQKEFQAAAITEHRDVFAQNVQKHIKALRDAARQGRDPSKAATFIPQPRLRKMSDIKAFAEGGAVQYCNQMGIQGRDEAIEEVFKWLLHLDAKTQAEDEAAWEAKRQREKAEKAALAAERAARKAAELANA